MNMKSFVMVAALLTLLAAGTAWAQSSDEENFQAMAAALRSNDAERQSAIDTCIAQGIGENPIGAAEFMGVTVENAAKAWCMRTTNGIADGKLSLADLIGLNSGEVSANAEAVLKTPAYGE